MTSLLAKANAALDANSTKVDPRWYPVFHLAAPAGWINDPNGLVWFNGWYHAFYQFHPYSTQWGPMHWGHARSKDLVHWEHLPVAIAPEGPEDKDGCFSGSAVVDGDSLALIYTGHKFAGDSTDDEDLYQVQCMARSQNGIDFKRCGVIVDTPAGVHHFRDPKVWREGEQWYMVVGARVNDKGQVRLYRSPDLYHWEDQGALAQSNPTMGYMWECPDFFKIDDRAILMFSPQGIEAQGYQFRNLFQSGYLIGDWQPGEAFHYQNDFRELDHGHDFYAPQSLLTPDGRRVIIGWLNMWQSPMPEQQDGWSGLLSVPRELILDPEDRLRILPVEELRLLRGQHYALSLNELTNNQQVIHDQAEALELHITWNLSASTAEQFGLSLGTGLRIYVDAQSQRLYLERRYPEFALDGVRSIPLTNSHELALQIYIDRSSVEVFINQGEYCMSSRIYPHKEHRQLNVFAHHGSAKIIRCEQWQLG